MSKKINKRIKIIIRIINIYFYLERKIIKKLREKKNRRNIN